MKTMLALSPLRRLRACGWIAACAMAAATLGAQSVVPRISSEVGSSEQTTLKGSLHPLAQAQFDAGRMPSNTKLNGVSIVFSRTAAQEADLDALIAAQQNPASPLFHQWLNPDQFAARFGMSDADLEQVKSWLERQGFVVDSVARSKNMIRFSGTTGQVEQAFSTQMHYYKADGVQHFAASTELSIPAALAGVVLAVRNLNDFRPQPMYLRGKSVRAKPSYTFESQGTQYVLFAPGDIQKVYDFPTSGSGYTGTGQSIAIMGQSAIDTSDIENFQSAASLATNLPTQVLVPGTGTSTVYSGDEGESHIDLEWSGATAPGAKIFFVYTGNSANNNGVLDSLAYAIDEQIGNIISLSYGSCEPSNTKSYIDADELILKQAAADGQTIVAASGDQGSTACNSSTYSSLGTSVERALAVNYPASSAYVTGVGGTEITSADDQVGTYWTSVANSSTINLESATQWIPEIAWNDNSSQYGLSASGGGPSEFVARPSWQAGTIGGATIPSGSYRLVPDIALYSSPNYPGYLYCTSDQTDWSSGQGSTCSGGNFYGTDGSFTVAGGTSFAAPIFAGMVAIINQKEQYTDGQGLINPTLYSMAADSATYLSAFHDVTSGNNDCTAGSSYCSSTAGFSAGPGYDEVTGLGSIDLNNMITDWAHSGATVPTLIGTTSSISAQYAAPTAGESDIFTITVTAASGSTTPSGTVTLSIDGGTSYSNGGSTATATLAASSTVGVATATYSTSFSSAGTHQIVVQYPGSSTLAASTGVVQVSVGGTSSGSGSFTMSATTTTISQGGKGGVSITVKPAGGYTGTVDIGPSASTASFCYDTATPTVSGTSAVTTSMTIDTNLADCSNGAVQKGHGMKLFRAAGQRASAAPHGAGSIAAAAFSLGGLFFAGLLGWRRRQLRLLSCLIALGVFGFMCSGCGGGGSSTSTDYTPKGTYSVTLTGQDSSTSTIQATATFSLVVD
jgi:subtilase family serine protease